MALKLTAIEIHKVCMCWKCATQYGLGEGQCDTKVAYYTQNHSIFKIYKWKNRSAEKCPFYVLPLTMRTSRQRLNTSLLPHHNIFVQLQLLTGTGAEHLYEFCDASVWVRVHFGEYLNLSCDFNARTKRYIYFGQKEHNGWFSSRQ